MEPLLILRNPPAAATFTLRRLVHAFSIRWWRLWVDDRTAFLADAADHVDLEYRQRIWDERDREDRVLPL